MNLVNASYHLQGYIIFLKFSSDIKKSKGLHWNDLLKLHGRLFLDTTEGNGENSLQHVELHDWHGDWSRQWLPD